MQQIARRLGEAVEMVLGSLSVGDDGVRALTEEKKQKPKPQPQSHRGTNHTAPAAREDGVVRRWACLPTLLRHTYIMNSHRFFKLSQRE